LKQRISKIDVGPGLNHIEDYLSCLSSAASYLSSGGSYMGATIVTILNLVLHTEQWLRWPFVKADNYYKPVEFGGFPVIEPLSTIISGGVANFYQRVTHVMPASSYSRLITNSLLCPPEEVSLEDFSRSGSERVKKTYAAKDLTIFKGTGPLGIFQLVRTDRKLSQFERRHGISKWEIPEKFATLKRDSPMASDFIFSLFRSTSENTLDTSLGINAFFIKMAEPWASYTRPCMRISEHSPFAQTFNMPSVFISHKELSEKLLNMTPIEAAHELNLASRRSERKAEFEIMEAQLAVRFSDAESIMDFLREQEAESVKISRVTPTIQTVTLRGHTASDSDSYMLSMIKAMAGVKAKGLINDYKRSFTTYDALMIQEPEKPINVLTSVVLADNAIALYNKFIRRNTKMIIPNKVDDLKELCLDILMNKFTENLGLVVQGVLNLDPERARPYAHSKWYQTMITTSAEFETLCASDILNGAAGDRPRVGISSLRPIITRNDMFEIVTSSAPEKTIVIDCKSKDAFINTVRTWLAAKVRFTLSRDTIKAFTSGRLTFAHDYYMGDNRFSRYAKNKYFQAKVGTVSGTHIINTKISEVRGRLVTTYRHILIFPEDISRRQIDFTIAKEFEEEEWVKVLTNHIGSIKSIENRTWYSLPKDKQSFSNNYRKTEIEKDFVIVMYMSPGQEYHIGPSKESLCITLKRDGLELPITYLNPESVDNLDIGYTLKHSDLVIATKCYTNLKKITGNFDKSRIASWPDLKIALDFILVSSTTDTPEYIIRKKLTPFLPMSAPITTIQLDILRTFLIKDTKVGIGYSSSRFTQYLLNLGHRRKHEHSYLCKTVMGTRAEADSEDWDVMSAEEDLIVMGKSNPAEVIDVDSEDDYNQPDHVLEHLGVTPAIVDPVDTKVIPMASTTQETFNWSEDVINNIVGSTADDLLDTQTAQDFNSWSESDSDVEVVPGAVSRRGSGLNSNYNSNIPEVTTTKPSRDNTPVNNLNFNPDLINNMFSNQISGDLFNFGDDSSEDEGETKGVEVDSLDKLFSMAVAGSYDKIKDIKDKGLKSERTGHTVNTSLESARAIITFLKEWINSAGSGREFPSSDIVNSNVSSITGFYLMMDHIGVLDASNPLEKFYGMDNMRLPVSLSALAVIGEVYN
jgi:hypothetical protein